MYHIFRYLFFLLKAETAHNLAFFLIKVFFKIPGLKFLIAGKSIPDNRKEIMGLTFKNSVGLAAGLDKDAELINEFAALGFGFVEIGTITPKPQPGNPKPRLFRLKKDHALINRMGFNNKGIDNAIENLKKRNQDILVGGNIGKNKWTENSLAYQDYLICYDRLYPFVDYFVVNVSSPNTPGLRSLQEKDPLTKILKVLKERNATEDLPKPILLKIAPDLSFPQLDDILEIVNELEVDGIVATNTTVKRSSLRADQQFVEGLGAGGLSGKPLQERSNEIIRYIRNKMHDLPIIGVGGIVSSDDAVEKLEAGADLIQLYTGFIYKGPALIRQILQKLLNYNF